MVVSNQVLELVVPPFTLVVGAWVAIHCCLMDIPQSRWEPSRNTAQTEWTVWSLDASKCASDIGGVKVLHQILANLTEKVAYLVRTLFDIKAII